MGKLWEFTQAVFAHWGAVMSGVVATFFFWLIGLLYAQRNGSEPLPWYIYIFVALTFVLYGCYRAWLEKDQYLQQELRNLQEAQRQANALNVALQMQLDDVLHNLIIGLQSPLTPPEKLAYIQRHRHHLQRQFHHATQEERIVLTKKLSLLEKQRIDLTPEQRPSQKYREQFYDVVRSIEELNAQLEQMRQNDHEKDTSS